MLSRLAESFYWIGRYLERAEATARLLAEHYHLTVEDRSVPDDIAAAVVLDALSLGHDVVTTPTELVRSLLGDAANPSTVIGSVAAARENARSVRDALSGDVFEALNGAHLTLTRGLTAAASPGASMYRVLERLMVVNGAIEWTMPRDEGRPTPPRVTRVRRSAVARQSAPVSADERLRQQEGQQQQRISTMPEVTSC